MLASFISRHGRRCQGVSICEAAASLSVILPLVFLMLYVVVEVSYAYLLEASLAQGAREAARDLAISYGRNPAVANNRTLEDASVFDNVRIHNIINDSGQFDDPEWNTGTSPHTVHVVVKYTGNKYGLHPFPYPDPLHLGMNFIVTAESTYRLE
jgi:hypothetical protein